jgi:hypothetical protein
LTHCADCSVSLRPDLPYYRDVIHHVELCVRCAQAKILLRIGLEFVPVFRGVRS